MKNFKIRVKEEGNDQGYQAKPMEMQLSLAGTDTAHIAGKYITDMEVQISNHTCRSVDTGTEDAAKFKILLKFLINVNVPSAFLGKWLEFEC